MCSSHTFCFSFPMLLFSPTIASHLYLCFSSSFLPCCWPLWAERVLWGPVCMGAGERILHPARAN